MHQHQLHYNKHQYQHLHLHLDASMPVTLQQASIPASTSPSGCINASYITRSLNFCLSIPICDSTSLDATRCFSTSISKNVMEVQCRSCTSKNMQLNLAHRHASNNLNSFIAAVSCLLCNNTNNSNTEKYYKIKYRRIF